MEDQIMPAKSGIFLYADSQCLLWNSDFSENSDLSACRELLILNFCSMSSFRCTQYSESRDFHISLSLQLSI